MKLKIDRIQYVEHLEHHSEVGGARLLGLTSSPKESRYYHYVVSESGDREIENEYISGAMYD